MIENNSVRKKINKHQKKELANDFSLKKNEI